jgi:hypothetical protein
MNDTNVALSPRHNHSAKHAKMDSFQLSRGGFIAGTQVWWAAQFTLFLRVSARLAGYAIALVPELRRRA